jgi:rhamnogalacturonan endolyase
MKKINILLLSHLVVICLLSMLYSSQMERLDRGLVAIRVNGGVFLSWRMLGSDPQDVGFNIYRDGVKINSTVIQDRTNYLDTNGSSSSRYFIRTVINGQEVETSKQVSVLSNNYIDIRLNVPPTSPLGATYSPNDASVGDLDGDGEYEIVLKWDPSDSKDNSQSGYTSEVFLDAYKLNGQFMWRIKLGRNIRAGAHYTQFIVYDLDGDGKAEVACKTADGTVDGVGNVIGDPNANWVNSSGYILSGPEYLTVFEGATGKALATVNYIPPRGNVSSWGDSYGNRVDRFLAAVAYLDGSRPSLIMCRGYYTKTWIVAWNWRNGSLTEVWRFNTGEINDGYRDEYEGQGNHNLSIADVDNDGRDEIIYGAMVVDDNGSPMYSTRLGHGDAMHVTDIDPDRSGLEVWQCHEDTSRGAGASLRDARTGQILLRVETSNDCGRALAADIDPNRKGLELWATAGVGLYDCKGNRISSNTPPINFAIWWDGDLLRELLDGVNIYKWDYNANTSRTIFTASGCSSNNSTKATPCLSADILGDWREEVIFRTSDNQAIRIYISTISTNYKFPTLMHNRQYRVSIAWQNVAYNQPPHTSFYLGSGMDLAKVYSYFEGPSGTTNTIYYTLTVNINPSGAGSVTLNPSGGVYVAGTTVTLTAVANSGWVFSGWSGSLTGSQNPATIVMNSSKTVTANFVRSSYTLTVNINPSGAGSVTLNPSGGVYVAGTTVTLTAVANSGWVFSSWSGSLTGSQNPATIVMNSSKTVTANFVQQSTTTQQPQRYTLTIDINPQFGGIVELNPQGGEYVEGTTVTLTAVANSGWVFSGWSGSLTGSQNPATIVMNSSKTVTANFVQQSTTTQQPQRYTLTIDINPQFGGIVELNPQGGEYVAGTTVTLTAVANSGWVFSGWSGSLTGSQNPATIVMNSSKTVTANFVQQSTTTQQPHRYTLTIDINPQFGGIVELNPQGGEYVAGTTVTLTAVANSGWVFSGWSGSLTGSQNPATIVMNSSKTVTANFVQQSTTTQQPQRYTLTIDINPQFGGIVELNLQGGEYVAGTTVTITAVANSGYVFSGWDGDLSGNENPAVIVMNSSKTVIANFIQQSSTTESGVGNGGSGGGEDGGNVGGGVGGGNGEGGGSGGSSGDVSGREINSKTNKLYINLTNKQTETILVNKTEVEWIKVYDLKGKLIDSYDGDILDVKRYKVGSYIFELNLKDGRTKYGTMVVVK